MANYVFEVNSLSQYSAVLESLRNLDKGLVIKEVKDVSPFLLDIRVKIQTQASFDEILIRLKETNAQMPIETIRPIQVA